jgi:hypothetical protein
MVACAPRVVILLWLIGTHATYQTIMPQYIHTHSELEPQHTYARFPCLRSMAVAFSASISSSSSA